MKKLSVILAVLLALTMLPAAGVSANGANLISNPGFEQVDENDWAVDWTRATEDSVIVEDTLGGDKCLAVYTKNKEVSYQIPSVSPDKDYALSVGFYRPGSGAKWKAIVYFYDDPQNGDVVLQYDTALNGGHNQGGGRNGWESVEFKITEIPESAVRAKVSLRATQTTTDPLYYDDIYFGEVSSEVAYPEDEATGTVAVSYNAYCPSSYEGDEPSIVALAALYKTVGDTKMLVKVTVSQPTALTAGAYTPVTLGSLAVPQDGAEYSCRVIALDFAHQMAPFEEFPIQEIS